jgi:hypothetical protein
MPSPHPHLHLSSNHHCSPRRRLSMELSPLHLLRQPASLFFRREPSTTRHDNTPRPPISRRSAKSNRRREIRPRHATSRTSLQCVGRLTRCAPCSHLLLIQDSHHVDDDHLVATSSFPEVSREIQGSSVHYCDAYSNRQPEEHGTAANTLLARIQEPRRVDEGHWAARRVAKKLFEKLKLCGGRLSTLGRGFERTRALMLDWPLLMPRSSSYGTIPRMPCSRIVLVACLSVGSCIGVDLSAWRWRWVEGGGEICWCEDGSAADDLELVDVARGGCLLCICTDWAVALCIGIFMLLFSFPHLTFVS